MDIRKNDDLFLLPTKLCVGNWTSADMITFFFALHLSLRRKLDIYGFFSFF